MDLKTKLIKCFSILVLFLFFFPLIVASESLSGKVEASTTTLGELPVGARVVDGGWLWQYRTGNNYNFEHNDYTSAVVWIVVAKDHYGPETGVTLLSEDLIGRYNYDGRIWRGTYPFNLWIESELHMWLNSYTLMNYPAMPGFKAAFSDYFKSKLVATGEYRNYWPDLSPPPDPPELSYYNMNLDVFIPSTTELGDTVHYKTVEIGNAYSYFSGAGNTNTNRTAKLKGVNTAYWTRSPYYPPIDAGEHIHLKRILAGGGIATTAIKHDNQSIGVRPALNLRSDTICVWQPTGLGEGYYSILNPPKKVILKSPLNGSAVGGTSITLEWNPLGEHQQEEDMFTYQLLAYGGNQNFNISDISGNSYTIHNLPDDGTTFNWMVRAFNPAGYGDFSDEWNFISGLDPYAGQHLYASFIDAVYAYDGSQWLATPVAHAPALALAAHEGALYGAFGDGIYIYDGTSWDDNRITPGVASNMASCDGKLYGSFADATYVYDGTSWAVFTWLTNSLASYQGHLYASFTDAVYAYDGDDWIASPVAHAPALALAVHEGKLYGAFADGIYVYDGTSWDINKITPGVASNMASYDGKLYGCFADATYVYDSQEWSIFTWPTNALTTY